MTPPKSTKTRIKLGLAQIRNELGNPHANMLKHLDFIEQAQIKEVDLLCFPELSLTGYALQDLVSQNAIPTRLDSPLLAPLLEASWKLDLVVGYIE